MNKLITIERKKLDPNFAHGVIVAESPALTLIHQEIDFQFDGYMAVRTKDITRCHTPESNDYHQRLMRREGLWMPVARWVKTLSVAAWPELFAGFVGKVVIFEDELKGEFYIGPILAAERNRAVIHYIDSLARLCDVEKVPYSRITSMRFGDRYSTILGKYLSSDGQPAAPTNTDGPPRGKR